MILTIEEARDVLRVDGADNDIVIMPLLEAIPEYLETTTGKRWDTAPIAPLAKTTASFILQLWYNTTGKDNAALQRTIDSLTVALTALGRA